MREQRKADLALLDAIADGGKKLCLYALNQEFQNELPENLGDPLRASFYSGGCGFRFDQNGKRSPYWYARFEIGANSAAGDIGDLFLYAFDGGFEAELLNFKERRRISRSDLALPRDIEAIPIPQPMLSHMDAWLADHPIFIAAPQELRETVEGMFEAEDCDENREMLRFYGVKFAEAAKKKAADQLAFVLVDVGRYLNATAMRQEYCARYKIVWEEECLCMGKLFYDAEGNLTDVVIV